VFLGYPVSVHKALVEPLAAVERSLQRLAQSNEETREFLEGLKGFAGYNWRAIAGTRSRSYHSYGIAIDLVPKSYGGLYAYWRWALPHERQWYSLPYEKRWMVPQPIVHAFEEQGFIWGGKWFFFDTMHFEYRPELLLLARQWRVGQIGQGLQVK
ncbi:MAG: M15 family metallopeptidase, partial [Spirochaetales bacterium]|nr:M15 family metallopeptidase [Spirochaetales bacterium]